MLLKKWKGGGGCGKYVNGAGLRRNGEAQK